MRRELALKIVLVIVGLLFSATVYPLFMFLRQDPALAMMLSLYVTLGGIEQERLPALEVHDVDRPQFLDLADEGSQLSNGERCLAAGSAMQKAVVALTGALQGEQDVDSRKHVFSEWGRHVCSVRLQTPEERNLCC